MNKFPKIIIAAFGATILLAGCASKPDPREGRQRPGNNRIPTGAIATPVAVLFAAMDQNRDRIVTNEEKAAGIIAEWESINRDADGKVSAIQINDWSEAAMGARDTLPGYLSFDTNLDRTISEAEFKVRMDDEFLQLDKNGDGQLTRSELLIVLPARNNSSRTGEQSGRGQGGRGQGGGGRGQGGRGGGRGG